jgi:hypothetical protein
MCINQITQVRISKSDKCLPTVFCATGVLEVIQLSKLKSSQLLCKLALQITLVLASFTGNE